MSLQVWLPLNGNLNDQGLTNIIVANNGAIINNNGKTGQCYSFNGTDSYLIADFKPGEIVPNEMSFCCWVKLNEINRTHTLFCSRKKTGAGLSIFILLGNQLRFDNGNDQNSSANQTTFNYTFASNVWYHIAVIQTTTQKKLYINGILQQSVNKTSANLGNNSATKCTIGASGANNATENWLKGYLNDVRVYNHALSDKEVEEISRGLILHYKLDNNGIGNENILTNSTGYMGKQYWAGLVTVGNENNFPYLIAKRTDTTTNGRTFCYHNVITSMVSSWSAGDKFTISGYYKVPSSETQDVVGNLFIRWQKSSGSHSDTGFNTESPNTVIKDTWIRFENTFTVPTGWDNTKTVEFHLSAFSKGLATIYWKQIKLEKGEKATSWIPAKTDSNYFIGIDNIIYDSSGYGNHGIISGSLITSTLSARYECSSYFDGNTSAVQTPNLATMITDKNYTISCWIYKMQIGSKNYQTIYGGPPGFELEARNSNSTSPLFRLHNWGGGTTPYEFNKWYHFCFVHSDTDSKLYINGELKIIGSSINVPPSGNYFIGAWNTSTQQNYDGNISDFRIYCTVLSEDQVKELYDTSVTIDNLGNAYARELVE